MLPALCHFYPGLTPMLIEQMTWREISEFEVYMYRSKTEGGDD